MLELTDKTDAELAEWIPAMMVGYAEQRMTTGEPREAAEKITKQQFATLLPDNRPGEGQRVMNLVLDGSPVGVLWMGRPLSDQEQHTWFVFYVEIDEAHRGRGLGREAMLAAESWTRAQGGSRITLNVFGHNTVARSLYDSLGYEAQATQMSKDLTTT